MEKILSYQTKLSSCEGGCKVEESTRHKREIPRIIEDKKDLDLFSKEIEKFEQINGDFDLELRYSCEYLVYDYYIAFLVKFSKFDKIKNIYLETNGSTSLFLAYGIDFSKLNIKINYSKENCDIEDLINTIILFLDNDIVFKIIIEKKDLDELLKYEKIKEMLNDDYIELKKENCLL
ncbi:MAG: hypothetical protein N4A54_04940 [Peptostreptococcaceae bacterium]|jgi:hypothetical protein|nr:hypothetical protein [Peptostreptococcaceae bacterium]